MIFHLVFFSFFVEKGIKRRASENISRGSLFDSHPRIKRLVVLFFSVFFSRGAEQYFNPQPLPLYSELAFSEI